MRLKSSGSLSLLFWGSFAIFGAIGYCGAKPDKPEDFAARTAAPRPRASKTKYEQPNAMFGVVKYRHFEPSI
jgi:hypothetical protein